MRRLPLPEAEVNVFCARSDGDLTEAPWVGREVNWRSVLEFAQAHGVLQFLSATLSRAQVRPPDPWFQILSTQQQRNAVRAMMQHRECAAIVRSFEEAKIAVVTFKGTSLSKLLYGRVADRISSDVDLLIRASDLPRAQSILSKLGYVPIESAARMDTKELLESGIEAAFVNKSGVVVEVHWQVLEPGQAFGFPNGYDSLCIVGDQISNEDLFLILIMHGLAHRWEMLKWIIDIDAFLRNVPIEWEAVWRRAAETGTVRATNIALEIVHELFGTRLPRPVEDRSARRLARLYVRSLLAGHRIRRTADFWMQIAARERWRERWKFVAFVVRVKPWDHTAGKGPKILSRVLRLLRQKVGESQLAEVQKIPELQRPPRS